MIPVHQTKKHNPPEVNGNCFAACVASILEISLDEVPKFEDMDMNKPAALEGGWWKAYNDFLKERDMKVVSFDLKRDKVVPCGWSIMIGRSPRNNEVGHCVVCWEGQQVHDPVFAICENEKDKKMIQEIWGFEVIIPIDASNELEVWPKDVLSRYDDEWYYRQEDK